MLKYSLSQALLKIKITTTITYFQKNVRINQLKNNDKNPFDSIIMLRFGETKVTKNKKIWCKKALMAYLGC